MAKPIFKSNDATGLLRYAESILMKMTQNADLFTDPIPSLVTFESLLHAYRDAYAEAGFRDKRAVIVLSPPQVVFNSTSSPSSLKKSSDKATYSGA